MEDHADEVVSERLSELLETIYDACYDMQVLVLSATPVSMRLWIGPNDNAPSPEQGGVGVDAESGEQLSWEY